MGISATSGPINQPFLTHEKPFGHKMKFKINKIDELCRIVAGKVQIIPLISHIVLIDI